MMNYTTKTTVTVREYDEQGRVVKETVTETVGNPNTYTWQQPAPYTITY